MSFRRQPGAARIGQHTRPSRTARLPAEAEAVTTVLDDAESSPVLSTVSADGVAVVTLRGEIDLVVVPSIRASLREIFVDGSAAAVRVDLSRVGFIDSSGLGVLLWAHKQARVFQVEFALVSPTPSVSQVMRVLGLDRILTVLPAADRAS